MKPLSLLFLLLLFPAAAFCQTINSPSVEYSDDPSTTIVKIETTQKYTAVVFKHIASAKGNWVQLNKSIYLQDADGEDRYNYLRSEGIALRPQKDSAAMDNQEINFTVYFEKLKPGTKSVNVIERAVSMTERMSGTNFFNFYNVSLEQPDTTKKIVKTGVTLYPPLSELNSQNSDFSMGTMMTSMYKSLFDAQIKFYSDKTKIEAIAKIDKSYYDALVKVGFASDQAIKILTSRSLISSNAAGK